MIWQGTKSTWLYCNNSLDYTENVKSVIPYHKNLTRSDLRALIYRYSDPSLSLYYRRLESNRSRYTYELDENSTGDSMDPRLNEINKETFATLPQVLHRLAFSGPTAEFAQTENEKPQFSPLDISIGW